METIFSQRMEPRYAELKQLYGQVYPGDAEAFAYFCGMLKKCLYSRKASLKAGNAADMLHDDDPIDKEIHIAPYGFRWMKVSEP